MDASPNDRPSSLRSLLVLALPLALFVLTIAYPLAVLLFDIHLGQRAIAFSVGIGFAVGTLAGGVLWLAGRRLLGVCVGILACSISIVAYVVLGLGIPLEWIIQ